MDYLRQQVGWPGIGQLILALGHGDSLDQALNQLVGLNAAGFESAWQTTWRQRLFQAQEQMTTLLEARQAAVVAGDKTAFLRTVDPSDPTLLAEERAWFADLIAKRFALAYRRLDFPGSPALRNDLFVPPAPDGQMPLF